MSDYIKHAVATDALQTLGSIIGEGEGRDAIHLAVEPAIAAHSLRPGEDVGFVEGGVGVCDKPVGIVDPFLKALVQRGQRFWLIVYPRQITSLRHVWEHPAFPSSGYVQPTPTPMMSASERWMREYAAKLPVKYEDLLYRAAEWVRDEEYWTEGGRFEGEWIPDDFWPHYENITGQKVEEKRRGSFFSCSC